MIGAQSCAPRSRRFDNHSNHATRRVVASSLPSAGLPCCNLPTLAAHAVVRSNRKVVIRTGGIALDGSANPHPLEHAIPGAPGRAPYDHLRAEPQPFGARPINVPTSLIEAPGRALSAPDNRNGRLTENNDDLRPRAHAVSPEHNLRPWMHALRGLKETCEYGRAHHAPSEELARRGRPRVRPEKGLELLPQPFCARKETCDHGRTHRAPLKKLAKHERTYTARRHRKRAAALAPQQQRDCPNLSRLWPRQRQAPTRTTGSPTPRRLRRLRDAMITWP